MKSISPERRSVILPLIFLLLAMGLLAAVDTRGDEARVTAVSFAIMS